MNMTMDEANKINDQKTNYEADQTTKQKKITLPKDLQTEMLKFFYCAIPISLDNKSTQKHD